ncbi:MAG: PH domain-containing protein [Pyrinomonadaceae bacterium]
MTYRSKKDGWLFGLVWGVVLGLLAVGLMGVLAPFGNPALGWALVRAGAAALLGVMLTTYPLDYEINGAELIARSGFMRWRVPLADIQEVRPTRSAASAPAWSLDRLRVEYLKGAAPRVLLISPEEKGSFMRHLADAAPGLELRGERVVRNV